VPIKDEFIEWVVSSITGILCAVIICILVVSAPVGIVGVLLLGFAGQIKRKK
jgi:hypothetical protein